MQVSELMLISSENAAKWFPHKYSLRSFKLTFVYLLNWRLGSKYWAEPLNFGTCQSKGETRGDGAIQKSQTFLFFIFVVAYFGHWNDRRLWAEHSRIRDTCIR